MKGIHRTSSIFGETSKVHTVDCFFTILHGYVKTWSNTGINCLVQRLKPSLSIFMDSFSSQYLLFSFIAIKIFILLMEDSPISFNRGKLQPSFSGLNSNSPHILVEKNLKPSCFPIRFPKAPKIRFIEAAKTLLVGGFNQFSTSQLVKWIISPVLGVKIPKIFELPPPRPWWFLYPFLCHHLRPSPRETTRYGTRSTKTEEQLLGPATGAWVAASCVFVHKASAVVFFGNNSD